MELVRWGNEHFDTLLRWSSDPRVTKFVGNGRTWSPEYAKERHEKCLRLWREIGYGWFAAVEDGVVVGLGSMADRGDEGVEIGWWVDPEHWGQGLATEIAAQLRDRALQLRPRVIAAFHDGNGASGRVME